MKKNHTCLHGYCRHFPLHAFSCLQDMFRGGMQIQPKVRLPLSSTVFPILAGIPFLSERSKHRVEAADNNSVDEEAGAVGGGWGASRNRKHLEKLLNADIEDILKQLQR